MAKKDYPWEIYHNIYEAERKHFWFFGRNMIIAMMLKKYLADYRNKSFLEVGCGTGNVLSLIEKMGMQVSGLDMHKEGLQLARKKSRKVKLICADVFTYRSKQVYAGMGIFDVLEHITDDQLFLKKCRNYLGKKGILILTVPADRRLWSVVDRLSGHKRRYDRKTVNTLLTATGFEILRNSYFNTFSYFPLLIYRKIFDLKYQGKQLDKRTILTESFQIPSFVNLVLKRIFCIERILMEYFSFPWGASLIVVARKK